jgi:putative phosphoribosyl transferase
MTMRVEADGPGELGREVAEQLASLSLDDVVIVALSPQSVSFAYALSRRLGCELDLLLVGHIGAPGHPDQAIGSLLDLQVPEIVVDEKLAREFHVPPGYLQTACRRQLLELARQHRMYFGEDDIPSHQHGGKDVVLVHGPVDEALLALVSERLVQEGALSVHDLLAPGEAQASEELGMSLDEKAVAKMLRDARRLHAQLH